MKKKMFFLGAFLALTAVISWKVQESNKQVNALVSDNVEALGNPNPLCPNGCVAQTKEYCWCNGIHENSKEYDWGD